MTFALNHMAYFLLTAALDERLAAAAPARVVSTSSTAHQGASLDFSDLQGARGYSGWRAYGRSKLANILFTREAARRLAGAGVTANCFHPGFVASRFGSASGGWTSRLMPLARMFAITPEEGADTLVYLASSPEVAKVTGAYFVKRKAGRALGRRPRRRGGAKSCGRRARRWPAHGRDARQPLASARALRLPALRRAVPPRHLQGGLKLRLGQRGEGRARPALPAPGVVERREGVGRDRAFERLLVGRELDVGAQFVGRERREGDARLEGAAVEMRVFARRRRTTARCGGSRRRRPSGPLGGIATAGRHAMSRSSALKRRTAWRRTKPGAAAPVVVVGAGPAGLDGGRGDRARRAGGSSSTTRARARRASSCSPDGAGSTSPIPSRSTRFSPATARRRRACGRRSRPFRPRRCGPGRRNSARRPSSAAAGACSRKASRRRRCCAPGCDGSTVSASRCGRARASSASAKAARCASSSPTGEETVEAAAAVFALGGASWPRLGADGGWVEAFRDVGVEVAPLKPANCGFLVDWSDVVRERFAGCAAEDRRAQPRRHARARRGARHGDRPRRRRRLRPVGAPCATRSRANGERDARHRFPAGRRRGARSPRGSSASPANRSRRSCARPVCRLSPRR